ncbi:MAG: putative heavy-metal-binding [Pseudomonadota bacterium]
MIYLWVHGQHSGPFSTEELRSLWQAQQISDDALYWWEGMTDWESITAFRPPVLQPLIAASIHLSASSEIVGRPTESDLGLVATEVVFSDTGGLMSIDERASGGRSTRTEHEFAKARSLALKRLQNEAAQREASAVVDVALRYSEFSGRGGSLVVVLATGSAVRLRPRMPPAP